MSELREKIARAIWGHLSSAEVDWEGFADDDYRPAADAVLAVLADLPESVIERAARWMYDEYTALMPDSWEWDEFGREEWRVDAREVLRAAFGGEQA